MFIITNVKCAATSATTALVNHRGGFDTLDALNSFVQDVAEGACVDVYADVREVWVDPSEGEEYTNIVRREVCWYPHYLPGDEWED